MVRDWASLFVSERQAQQAILAEADGVLAAIPPGVTGPELSFLARYKDIADLLSEGAARSSSSLQQQGLAGESSLAPGSDKARLAGALAVEMLAPRGGCRDGAAGAAALLDPTPPPPPRSWPHLLRLSVPALEATTAAAMAGAAAACAGGGDGDEEAAAFVTADQAHVLLARLQALTASEHRVGSVRGVRGRSLCLGRSTLASVPAPYGGEAGGREEEVSEIRRALAACLGATMMIQNAREAAPSGGVDGGGQGFDMLLGGRRLPAEALIAPRVAV